MVGLKRSGLSKLEHHLRYIYICFLPFMTYMTSIRYHNKCISFGCFPWEGCKLVSCRSVSVYIADCGWVWPSSNGILFCFGPRCCGLIQILYLLNYKWFVTEWSAAEMFLVTPKYRDVTLKNSATGRMGWFLPVLLLQNLLLSFILFLGAPFPSSWIWGDHLGYHGRAMWGNSVLLTWIFIRRLRTLV